MKKHVSVLTGLLISCVSLHVQATCTIVTNDSVVTVTADVPECLGIVSDGATDVRGFILNGPLSLMAEGTIAAANGAYTPFFNGAGLTAGTPKVLTVGQTGLTFQYGGTDPVDFGLTPVFPLFKTTTVLATQDCPNNDFEYSVQVNAWTFDAGGSPDGTWAGGYGQNDNTSICAAGYGTPHGNRYAVLRRLNTMSIGFSLNSEGAWRVSFLGGCRPGYQSNKLPVTVKIDAGTAGEQSYTFPAEDVLHGFLQYYTDPFDLAAGSHTITFAVGDNSVASSMRFIDWIRFERVSVAEGRGSLAKTGSGTLSLCSARTAEGTVSVNAGALELHGAELTNMAVNVAADATLRFCSTRENLVQNNGFEAGVSPWGFVRGATQASGSDVMENGNATFAANGPYTTHGTLFAYVRTDTRIQQQVLVPRTGKYLLSFSRGNRNYGNSNKIKVEVRMNETLLYTSPADQPFVNNFVEESAVVDLVASETPQWLSFTACDWTGSGAMFFLDDVQLRSLDATYPEVGTSWNLTSGSTVDLQNADKLILGTVTVDGQAIRGGRKALTDAGVTVTGGGSLRIGDPFGMVLIFR